MSSRTIHYTIHDWLDPGSGDFEFPTEFDAQQYADTLNREYDGYDDEYRTPHRGLPRFTVRSVRT